MGAEHHTSPANFQSSYRRTFGKMDSKGLHKSPVSPPSHIVCVVLFNVPLQLLLGGGSPVALLALDHLHHQPEVRGEYLSQ